jgi:Zn-dependent protease/CBS domain-containing protein
MSSSWRIGRVFGIDVFMHVTFLLLLGWIAAGHVMRGEGLAAALGGVLFTIGLFAIVVMHELGHALTARRFGIQTKDITLLPIGGVARLERMPDDPMQELLVALAGPAVNVVLAAGVYVAVRATGGDIGVEALTGGNLLARLFWVNVSLAVFNLLPAFPMDGGRALRAILAMKHGAVKATQTAAKLGQAMAVLLGLVGLLVNPMLVLVALFVWIGAASERGMVEAKASLDGVRVEAAMQRAIRALGPYDPLSAAGTELLAGSQVDFPVIDEVGHVVGMLSRAELVRGLSTLGPNAPVHTVMTRAFATADPVEPLELAVARLRESDMQAVPVLSGGTLVGMLTMDNVGELLMLRSALEVAAQRAHVGHASHA